MDNRRIAWREKFRSVQSQPDLMRKYRGCVNSAKAKSTLHGTEIVQPHENENILRIRTNRPHTAKASVHLISRPSTAKAVSRPGTAQTVRSYISDQGMSAWDVDNDRMSHRHINRITSARSRLTGYGSSESSRKIYQTETASDRSESMRELLATRGSQFSSDGKNYDVIEKVRAQSCRRRSARLDPEERKKIINSHNQTTEEKVQRYYQLQREKKALELDLATRRAMALARFKKSIWEVLWIIRWKRAMIAISLDNMVMTAMEMDWHTRNTDTNESQFRREDYSRSRVSTKVPAWAEKILRKPAEWRTESECSKLHALMRPLKSFEKFTEKIQWAMCKAMRYEFVDAKRIVLRKGHPGICFYFIYSGSTFVNVEDKGNDGETFTKTAAILHSGESFGNISGSHVELALLRDSTRAATITCREDCELLTVDKEIFASVCPAIFEEELNEKLQFVRKLPLFMPNLWSEESLKQLCFESQIKQYKNNKVIVADNSNEEWLYICMEGSCQVLRCLVLETVKDMVSLKSQVANDNKKIANIFSKIINEGQVAVGERRGQKNSAGSSRGSPAGRRKRLNTDENNAKRNKSQMLNSMALDWFKAHEQVEEMKRKNREQTLENNRNISGMKTFTSLMRETMEEANKNGDEALFVEIAQLYPNDAFDIQAILNADDVSDKEGSALILVSSGAKMLRLKRADLFRAATFEALEYIKTMTAHEAYPTETELLQRYNKTHSWDKFRMKMLSDATSLKPGKTRAQRNVVMNRIHSAKSIRNDKLLRTLKDNDRTAKENNRMSLDEEQRQMFQFELDRKIQEEAEEMKRAEVVKSEEEPPSPRFRRVRRVSATGTLPNLIQQLVLDSTTRDKPQVHPVNRHEDFKENLLDKGPD